MSSSASTLRLYRQMLREAQKFRDYNFRSYAVRRTRDGFRSSRSSSGPELEAKLQEAREGLEMIKRQTTVGNLFYPTEKVAVEVLDATTHTDKMNKTG